MAEAVTSEPSSKKAGESSYFRQYDKRSYAAGWLQQRLKSNWSGRGVLDSDRLLEAIESHDLPLRKVSDEALKAGMARWRRDALLEKVKNSDSLVEALSTLREASRRVLGLHHYPEQLMAGIALVEGGVAEQATGEGKTLTITLPAFWFGLTGKGVHVVTVNPYLAERDCEFVTPLFEFFGLSVGLLEQEMEPEAKREMYRKDIVYGTGYDFGFDYLRDQLQIVDQPGNRPVPRLCKLLAGEEIVEPSTMHRRLSYAIVDEIDSVLIDEAGSPLLISQHKPGEFDDQPFHIARNIAGALEKETDYAVKNGNRLIIKNTGLEKIHASPEVPWSQLVRPWRVYIQNALTAIELFQRDSHYIVKDEKVVIIDEFTGRAHEERNWKEGLHQAVEAKEGLPINPETESSASITRQRFFTRYDSICGITGTAMESAGELWHFFNLPVKTIPLHRPGKRRELPERVFSNQETMYEAVIGSVAERQARGQPVLIGTRTILASEALSVRLEKEGISHELLTAKHDEEENRIIAGAGQAGAVVIATNMAGRGTHIDLTPEAEEAGGLHVIAVERNESIRIDRQLFGRCARQGKPGSIQSFVSLEDELLQRFSKSMLRKLHGLRSGESHELPSEASRIFDKLQRRLEQTNYQIRLQMAERDKWNDKTRQSLS
ncbi:MAG: hypothetical protein P1U68_05835 [Verrucomicrobiales bacterium]|nr:hypothetical protein [Verrucomicrobiales bacterium]